MCSHVFFKTLQLSSEFVAHPFFKYSFFTSLDILVFQYFYRYLSVDAVRYRAKCYHPPYLVFSITTSSLTFYVMLFSLCFVIWLDCSYAFCSVCSISPQVLVLPRISLDFPCVFWFYIFSCFTVVLFFFQPHTRCTSFLHRDSIIHPRTCCGGGLGFVFC